MLLRAFAKVNLDLRVLHRRADGFHEVRTILQTIDWFDEIRVEPASRFEFITHGGSGDESNLVVRAVREFERLTAVPANLAIRLTKNIPIGAGLGGGSADAAVTFLALRRILGAEFSDIDQLQCLKTLGSDVPFFAIGGQALATGRGENVEPLEDRPEETDTHFVIVNPGIAISTREAYSWLTVDDKSNSIEGFRTQFVSGYTEYDQANDFEGVVFARHPMLQGIQQELLRLGALRASLSGSGSALFGVFRTHDRAAEAASRFAGRFNARVTKPLPRSEYLPRVFGD
jgi:4-diphosphocytidyl-2-C-methyl-D-erythritol kinase